MIGGMGLSAMGLAMAGALAAVAVPQAAERPAETATEARGEALGDMIASRLRAEGPFFTPAERVVIERACGYAPGEWDGFDASIHDGVLTCTNGRRADSAEARAVVRAAEPRIQAFVDRVMASPEVTGAIARFTDETTAEALRGAELALARASDALGDLDIDVDVDPGDGVDVDVEVDDDD